jgi:hypothetical protein
MGLANSCKSETCVGSRVRLVGVFISFEKNFYRLPFTPPLSGSPYRSFRYADLRKVITFDASAHDDLDHHGRLHSGAVQGHQTWGVEVEIDQKGVKAAAERCKWDYGGHQRAVETLSTKPLIWGTL